MVPTAREGACPVWEEEVVPGTASVQFLSRSETQNGPEYL